MKDWDVQINYGIKTGCNDAFIVDSVKRNEILNNCITEEERQKTAEIIRPILRGRDIKKYGYEFADQYIIATFPSRKYNIDEYFRIIFDNEGADWTFVCPPNYKNITNKEKRITEFFNDGVDAITEFLKQIGYDVPINVPRRYRRHMDYLKNSEY